MTTPEKIKSLFPIFDAKKNIPNLVYLDNAATTQKPASVIDAEREFYETINANVHRSAYNLSQKATAAYEGAHKEAAIFINARSWEEIVFTRNATEAINLVSYSLPKLLGSGGNILVTKAEHHSNLLPWQRMAKQNGIELNFVDVSPNGRLDMRDFKYKLENKPSLVACTHASNVTGAVMPIDEIVSAAHDVGALVLVDAAQSIAHLPLDVQKNNADFLVFSSHKMYGPLGIGVLYGRKNILEKMEPFLLGGDMVKEVSLVSATWNDLPWKFEAGTPNIAGAVAFGEAVKFIRSIGFGYIQKQERKLTEYLVSKLLKMKEVKIVGPADAEDRIGVVSFFIPGLHSHDIISLLDTKGIAIRGGYHCAQPLLNALGLNECCRVSLGVTNTKEDVDRLIDALYGIIKLLKR